MAVQVQQEQIDHSHIALTIEVPPEDIQKAVETVFNQFAKRTTVPGFRPGKAPRHLVKRFIDEGRVREMALDQSLTNAYRDALKQANVDPYPHAEPQVELPEDEVDPDKGFSFKATIALQPHVHLGSLEGLTARRVITPIADEDVDREIERFRERAAIFEATEEPAAEGDRVRAMVHVSVDGELLPEMHFHDPTLIQIGSNLDEFDAGMTGIKAGEEKSFDFTLPEDWEDEEKAGKTATAEIQAVEVLRRTVPEADDEFAKKVGFDDLEGLKTRVREMLQAQSDAMADQSVNNELIDSLVRGSEVHFPEEMIERELTERMDNLIAQLQQRGATLEDYIAANKTDLASLQAQMREEAEGTVRNTLVLLEVARRNQITVDERDIEDEVKARAESENVKASQIRRLLKETGEIDSIRNRIFFRKIAKVLRESAEIREVEA
jgi:trigger factor